MDKLFWLIFQKGILLKSYSKWGKEKKANNNEGNWKISNFQRKRIQKKSKTTKKKHQEQGQEKIQSKENFSNISKDRRCFMFTKKSF